MISLICCDVVFAKNEEFRRKSLHDTIIKELGIEESKEFIWGKIISEYDAKSNVSSIGVIYF